MESIQPLSQDHNSSPPPKTGGAHPMPTPRTPHTYIDKSISTMIGISDHVIRLCHIFVDLGWHILEVAAVAADDEHFS